MTGGAARACGVHERAFEGFDFSQLNLGPRQNFTSVTATHSD